MKAEKILDMINSGKIEELKESLSQEIKLESIGSSSSKSNFKAVYNYLKKVKQRPLLHYCDYQNGMQVFTNSYFATSVEEEDYNPLIPDYRTASYGYKSYPLVSGLAQNLVNSIGTQEITKTYDELVEIINGLKAEQKKNNTSSEYFQEIDKYFDYKLLEIALKSLNPSKTDTYIIRYHNDSFRSFNPILIQKSHNKSYTLVCPCKKVTK